MKKVIIISVIALISLAAMAQDKKVVVFNEIPDNLLKEIIREEIISIIVNTDGYTLLAEQVIEKEEIFRSLRSVGDSLISLIGKQTGADLIFVTSLRSMDQNRFHISCKVIDVQTTRIKKHRIAYVSVFKHDKIIASIQKLVREML